MVNWKGLKSGMAMRMEMKAFPPGSLPETPAARLEMIMLLLRGFPVVDEDGNETGEYTGPMITEEQAKKLLDGL